MSRPLDPAVVWLRAVGAGSIALAMGVVGHVMADGLLPGPAVLVVLVAVTVVATVPVMSRPLSPLRALAYMVAGQTFVHLTLTLSAGHRGDVPANGHVHGGLAAALPVEGGRRVGSLQDAYQAAAGGSGALSPKLPVAHLVADLSAHAPMMLGHLLAAAVLGLWLGWGEQAIVVALTLLFARLLDLVVPRVCGLCPRPGLCAAALARVVPLLPQWQAQPGRRRGPPVVLA